MTEVIKSMFCNGLVFPCLVHTFFPIWYTFLSCIMGNNGLIFTVSLRDTGIFVVEKKVTKEESCWQTASYTLILCLEKLKVFR